MGHAQEIESRRVLVSLKTLSEMMDSHRSTVRRWLEEAGIHPVAVGGKSAVRYRWNEVEAWIQSLPEVR